MRRSLMSVFAVAIALSAASPALATDKVVPAEKFYPFLKGYLSLPPAERNHFRIAYFLHQGPQPIAPPVWLLVGGAKIAVPVLADGRVGRLASLAELETGQVQVGVDAAIKLGTTIDIEPIVAPAAVMDAREIALSIDQAAAGVRKAAGVMALAMPKIHEIGFIGVASGEVELADGRRQALPLVKGVPIFNPASYPNAKTLRFPKAPTKLDMD